jgi:hypothetical protein
MATQVLLRRDSAANWTAVNPILGEAEVGVELDTFKFKIGNGSTAWSALPYANDTDGTGYTLPIASNVTLGGVKVGTGLSMDANGVMSVSGGAIGSDPSFTGTMDGNGGTITDVVFGQTSEAVVALGGITGTANLNLASGSVFTATLTGSVTLGVINAMANASSVFALVLTNGGAFPITFPASFAFDSGVAPSLQTNGVDVLIGILDGSTWRVSRGWRAA